jgi:TPP-dependent 2-oxoacid decarboxylase
VHPAGTSCSPGRLREEQQPYYVGMYDGRLMDESVRSFVESCD